MTGHALAVAGASVGGVSTTGWWLGFTLGFLVLLVVLMLVIPILLLARSIGKEALMIDESLTQAVHNTAPLAALRTTIEHATIIIDGLHRGRTRLGG
jgi:ABC-type sulfate transport system permease component